MSIFESIYHYLSKLLETDYSYYMYCVTNKWPPTPIWYISNTYGIHLDGTGYYTDTVCAVRVMSCNVCIVEHKRKCAAGCCRAAVCLC